MVYKSKYANIDIPECNILSYLFPRDTELSTKPLWIDADTPSNSLSPAAMLLWIKRFAVGLENLGVQENQAVMVFTPNHIFVPVVYLAAAGSRRYYTGANPAYTVDELAYQMSTVDVAVALIHPSLITTGLAAAKKVKIPTTRIFLFSDSVCSEHSGIQDWKTFLASKEDAASWDWDNLDHEAMRQIATINFSSGTTGLPKGVCTSHHNLVSNAAQVMCGMFESKPLLDVVRSERWLASLPLYHAFSQLYTINMACRLGVTVYVMRNFALSEFLGHIQRHKITLIQTVPPVIAMLAKSPETAKYDLSSLRNIMVGAAPMSLQLQLDMMKRFGFYMCRGWGMTETTCVGTKLPINVKYAHDSVGYLLPNTEAKIVNEDGAEIDGGPGELWVRGPQMMLGYWGNIKATQEAYAEDGWLKTGDIVTVKDDLWWIVDRKKELIKVNGLQVAPAELEAVLLQHESISDAAVIGLVMDGNEYPRAYVVLKGNSCDGLTERDVQRFVAKRVAKHKQLRGGVQFKEAIPRLLSGKIMRSVVKNWSKADAKSLTGPHPRL